MYRLISFSSHFRNLVFGYFWQRVTKILHNSLFTFLLSQARQAKTEMKISQLIFGILVVLTKTKLKKICNEPGKCLRIFTTDIFFKYNRCVLFHITFRPNKYIELNHMNY